MLAGALDIYLAAFVARCHVMRGSRESVIDESGVRGLLPCIEDPNVRLLVTDDRAYDGLAALLPDVRGGRISVLAAAARCADLLHGHPAWAPDAATAMVCRDLQTVPAVTLPCELTLRPVQRLAGDAPEGVALKDAVATAMLSAPAIEDPPEVFADSLRSLPPSFRLFAAVDGEGTVCATSGSGTFGSYATVIFVNTQPEWRNLGIGYAMTAFALRAARASGARQACLDSSGAGLSIYQRLGFETVSVVTRFMHGG